MTPFAYMRVGTVAEAVAALQAYPGARALAGGTNLVDLMRVGADAPHVVVDISALPLDRIEALPDGGLRVGALVRNSDLAAHPEAAVCYPMLSQSLLAGASQQLRNRATVGGNLLQRWRCAYFRGPAWPCNRREAGSGCGARGGETGGLAVLGTSDQCLAQHPSDMCVALAALDAVVRVEGPDGGRAIPMTAFHRLPGDAAHLETELRPAEVIIAVDLPPLPLARNSLYLKRRERSSYAFALASVAAALDVSGGQVRGARIALGGVATVPWRAREAEAVLVGAPAGRATYERAAEAAFAGARPTPDNAYKVPLGRRAVVAALLDLERAA